MDFDSRRYPAGTAGLNLIKKETLAFARVSKFLIQPITAA